MEDTFIDILKDFFNQTKSLNKKVRVLSVSDGIWQLFLTGHTSESKITAARQLTSSGEPHPNFPKCQYLVGV